MKTIDINISVAYSPSSLFLIHIHFPVDSLGFIQPDNQVICQLQ